MKMNHLESILNNIRGGVILCNYNPAMGSSEVVYINSGWTDITGYTREELIKVKNGNPQAIVLTEDKWEVDTRYREQLLCGSAYELMYRIVHRNGGIRWVIDKGVVTQLPGGIMQNQSIITEVTVIKEQEERLRFLAQIDQLTDLNNKATFNMLAQSTLKRQREQCHALLLLDIDNFKGFNDNYGHAFGDKVLEAVAGQMKELFRSRDILGRIGGDEFIILMIDVPNSRTVEKKANDLRRAISSIGIPGTHHTPITVSIGGALFSGGKTYAAIFDEADSALYCAKNNGKNQFTASSEAVVCSTF